MSQPLNKEQEDAVTHTGSPLIVRAGPGSGKTLVITERIKFLLENGLAPSEIMCLTFSEKAAASIRERLELDEEITKKKIDISPMQISTYHSFCRNFLLENTMSTGLGMHGGIVNRATFLVWGLQSIDSFGFDEHIKIGNNAHEIIEAMIDGISTFNDELVSPEELEDWVAKKISSVDPERDIEEYDLVHRLDNMCKMYKKHVEFKKEIDAMDFDDLVVFSCKLLSDKAHDNVLKKIQKRFRHVLVDEFQDNNYAQFSLVRMIGRDGGSGAPFDNITAVGDPDQNIYRFQGAYTQIFDHFRKAFPKCGEIFLKKNYRNPKSVIEFSSEMISQDVYRTPPPVAFEAVKTGGSKVNVVECGSDLAQAMYVKDKILEIKNNNPGYTFDDFAILSRKQRDGLIIAHLLASEGVPVKYVGKTDVHRSPQAKFVFSLLRVITDPANSMVDITRVMQEYGITEQNISRVNLEATKRARGRDDGDHAFDVISDQNVPDLSQKGNVKEIHAMLSRFIELAKNHTVSDALYKIIRTETNTYKAIANDGSIEKFIERSVLSDIISSAYDLESIMPLATMRDFLDFISHLHKFDVETDRGLGTQEAVQASTVHQSKGLEFKVVFVVDVATRKFPLKDTPKEFYVPADLAKGVQPVADPHEEFLREERRILYVAMTRAIDHLFVTYPTHYEGNKRGNKSSIFLQKVNPKTNANVNFTIIPPLASTNVSTSFGAVDIIKNERTSIAINQMQSGQYQSAIESIMDLAKIRHFEENGNLAAFNAGGFAIQSSGNIDGLLDGTISQRKEFSRPHLSVTAIEPYEKCPKQFWYKEILNVLPQKKDAPALTKGGLFHRIVEDSARRQLAGKGPDDHKTLLKELESRWGGEASRAYLRQPITKEEEDKESLEPALESFANWSKANKNKIVALEHGFMISIGGFPWKGKIDRVEMTPGGDIVLVDYKTGGKSKVLSQQQLSESIQLNAYVMAARAELQKDRPFGIEPGPGEDWKSKKVTTASFFFPEKNHLDTDTNGVHLSSKSSTGKADGQWYDYQVNDTDVENARKKLEAYITAIQNGEFEPPPGWKDPCDWCDFKDICGDAKTA